MTKTLSFYEFTQLSKDEQYHIVFTEGKFVDVNLKNNIKYVLYEVFGFFAEVVFDSENNKVISLTSFLKA